MKKRLVSYRDKRDFSKTPEPAGEAESNHKVPLFVVQKHDAKKLHYDFRLEVNGVLKSWAVPKGPSPEPSVKRLAVATEDHPLEYADFEGYIPAGEYGAGPVIVWDRGFYSNITQKKGQAFSIEQAIEHGHVTVLLDGERLKGAYSLSRIRSGPKEQWLMVKVKDKFAADRDLVTEFQDSVLSGRTLEDISNESMSETPRAALASVKKTRKSPHAADPFPSRIKPMMALLSKMPADQEQYGFEFKWDGIRAISYWDGKTLRIESRNLLDITFRWPELQKLGELLGDSPAVLDGEIITLDEEGKVSFGLLKERMHLSKKPSPTLMQRVSAVYMMFDLLYYGDRSLMELTYKERRKFLEKLGLVSNHLQVPPSFSGRGQETLAAAVENHIEGIVAKRLDSGYETGKRSGAWIKIKTGNRQELVIGGWIPEKGTRSRGVGALLVGYYDNAHDLVFAGKVGTGFTDACRIELMNMLDQIEQDTSPFASKPSKEAIYVKPQLVAEIEFREWTSDGVLRHPSFKGLREDKDPREVVREDVAAQ